MIKGQNPKCAASFARQDNSPQKIPNAVAMPTSAFLYPGGHVEKHTLVFYAICGKILLKGQILGRNKNRCKKPWSMNGAAVRDDELILWGIEAIPQIYYFTLNCSKTMLLYQSTPKTLIRNL